jgi:hypothetical protein
MSWKDSLSGSFGACCLVLAGQPFDTIKVLAQTSKVASSFSHALRVVESGGVKSLWRGAGPALASALIDNTVLFTLQRSIQRMVAPEAATEAALSPAQHAICGGLAGFCSATAICPAELIKCRMQVNGGGSGSGGGVAIALDILRREGVPGLFRGWTPLVARDVPLQTVFFGSYMVHSHALKLLADTWAAPLPWDSFGVSSVNSSSSSSSGGGGQATVPGWRAFWAGGLAGSTAWMVIFPLDVVKSRMQTEVMEGGVVGERGRGGSVKARLSFRETTLSVWKEGGVGAFYRGLGSAMLRAFPANAALFWGVEVASALLKDL